ncbi:RHS repeat-associated core domain-containing protein [Pseudomonas sp. PGPR40]|uniref:RHS repeat-associated core domain-containing protein n=1 Tax=Pseudomonas sp. PGPR40 TaxID=2913476 RepID=UPI001ED9D3AA|nr:RHS repeat-associated core domain-containing protein [Pseudomonas sp. PGPR40]
MLLDRETLLCRYDYDPLDRLVDCTPSAQANVQRFYLKDRLATEIQDAVQRSIMQHDDQLLAQQQRQSGAVETRLLAIDQQRSVLNVLDRASSYPLAYTPYGHRPAENGLLSLLGFNGERPDPVTGAYLLGNGYRAFNPVLMRFNSPDSLSPFAQGGLNAYAYCMGDPINRVDASGRSWTKVISLLFSDPHLASTTKLKNKVDIASDITAFDDHTKRSFFKKDKRLNVIIHGNGVQKNNTHMGVTNGKEISPQDLTNKLASNTGLSDNKYRQLHLIMCHGGAGSNPYAQQVANLTGLPTTSYIGRVSYSTIQNKTSQRIYIHQSNKLIKSDSPHYSDVTYNPVHFNPIRTKSDKLRSSP